MDFNNGGREAILRMLEAYEVSTRKALCERLEISTSTMSTRWMRDVFPADWIIKCSIETSTPVEWLSFGTGSPKPPQKSLGIQSANKNVLADLFSVPRKKNQRWEIIRFKFLLT
ncbi:helix-turn-helix transcriptional regulator [Atlantibacter sp.]|uniref:helix-turn-helix transcriptional regulator n=1 Tax=Atlantibacter sp. TaxID=1903473 RepID=UPI00289D6E7A|nr:helix-turn-helix transcriptional regulator [Atlantibacter sp.]